MVEIADFGAVREAHSVAQPIESIGQNDFANTARRQSIFVNRELNPVAVFEVDLTNMRCGK